MAPSAPAKPGSKGLMERGLDFISDLGSNLTVLYRAATLAAVMKCAGCAVEGNDQPEPAGIEYAIQQAALTKDVFKGIDSAEKSSAFPAGSERINFAFIGGKPYFFSIKNSELFVFSASDLKTGLTQSSTVKKFSLPSSQVQDATVDGAVVIGNQIFWTPAGEAIKYANLIMEGDQMVGIGSITSLGFGGSKNLLSAIEDSDGWKLLLDGGPNDTVLKYDPKTGKETELGLSADGGLPTYDKDTGTAFGTYKAGSLWRPSSASSLEALQGSQKTAAVKLLPGKSIEDMRLVKDASGEFLVFVVKTPDSQNPGKFLPSEVYFHEVKKDVVNPDPDPKPDVDAGSTETDGGEPDATDGTDSPDATDTTDGTDTPDTTDTPDATDTPDSEDADLPKDAEDTNDSGPDSDADGTDAADTNDTKDTTADTKDTGPDATPDAKPDTTAETTDTTPDTSKPDTNPKPDTEPAPECVTEIPKRIQLKVGPCEMEICPTKIGAFEGHTMQVTAENAAQNEECTVEVLIKGISVPATLTFKNTKGGKIDVTCTIPEEVGEDPECTNGTPFNNVNFDEDGHKFHTKDPKGITSTGSTATKYSWEYMGVDAATGFERFAVANHDAPGTPPLIVNHKDGKPFIVEANGRPYVYNVSNGQVVDDQGKIIHEAIVDPPVEGGKDADVQFIPDKPPVITTPPPDDGCSASPGSLSFPRKNLPGYIALGSIAFLALWRRRKQEV